MRTHYNHIEAHHTGIIIDTKPRYVIKNVNQKMILPHTLGHVEWHQGFERYVFSPYLDALTQRLQPLTSEQLEDVVTFIKTQL